MDLGAPLAQLLTDLARATERTPKPFVTILFGNPYVLQSMPTLPAVMLTYDFYDLAERSAARALAGDAPIGGRVPVAIPSLFEAGFGLAR
jgi:beta-N-acetylhexosaminidase